MSILRIGAVRGALLLNGSWRWNALVRDCTAWLEVRAPWLIRS